MPGDPQPDHGADHPAQGQSDHLVSELEHLECTIRHDGFKVEGSTGFTDDCADAVACCVWCLANDGEGDWQDMFSVVQQ